MSPPRLIALDWGTSSLRAYLLGAGAQVLDSRTRNWGIQHTPDRDFARAYQLLIGDWLERWPELPALAAGMIGSRQGWLEVPYVPCPADERSLAEGLRVIDTGCGALHLVPGVMQGGARPNVLRGEETQVVGALALDPALRDDALLVLPGTHSKWASIREGRLVGFDTYLTGELFALLRDHSILGRPALESGAEASPAAFAWGLRMARDAEHGIADQLFSVRSLVLCGQLAPAHSLDYLSGLLIGEELRGALAGSAGSRALVLLGDPALCQRYRDALGQFGHAGVRILDNAGVAGLWRVAEAAGLLTDEVLRLA